MTALLSYVHLSLLLMVAGFAFSQSSNTTITLKNGGSLLGRRMLLENVDVDLFFDIPYAKQPVGDLRFKKPEAGDGWSGVRDARYSQFKICPQMGRTGAAIGTEDCLYLDISVPGGVDPTNKKPVMFWIHGGGYVTGSKDIYPGAALAAKGEVIVVAINYRLGALGFLPDGKGTGNFGLWDQREALLWVKENIATFGGDPDLVTIFGESAGSGSVSAQTLGRYSEGLFQRAIQQSGALFDDWSWHLTENRIAENSKLIKQSKSCKLGESVYQCLSGLSAGEVIVAISSISSVAYSNIPTPDDDFFPDDITLQSYALSQRFDEMIGFNKDEGFIFANITTFLVPPHHPVEDGYTMNYTRRIFEEGLCPLITPLSIELCVDYLINLYDFESIVSDEERARAVADSRTDISLSAGPLQQLREHSKSKQKSTYAYYFTEELTPAIDQFYLPAWVPKRRADHAEDIAFVLGGVYIKNYFTEYYGEDNLNNQPGLSEGLNAFYYGTTDAVKPLTDKMMTMWTNFAKSGNPNLPVTLTSGSVWPQFEENADMFMELNSTSSTVISTPRKEKLHSIITDLFSARTLQLRADSPPQTVDCPVKQQNQSPTQEVKSNSQRPTLKLQLQMMSLLVLVLLHALF